MELALRLASKHPDSLQYKLIDSSKNEYLGGICLILFDSMWWISNVFIYDDLQKKNLGTNLISLLISIHPTISISLSDKSEHHKIATGNFIDSRYVTDQGLKLVSRCFGNGILKYENFKLPYPIVSKLFEANPFLDISIVTSTQNKKSSII